METNTTEATTEATTKTTETTQTENLVTCATCKRSFKNAVALAMHVGRTHTKNIKVPFQGSPKSAKEKQRLAKRRKYQQGLRARYKLEGKDSRGYPIKGNKKSKFGGPWTPERRARFEKTWRDKQKANRKVAKQESNSHHPPQLEDPRDFINCCPNCGTNLQAYYLAARAAKRHGK